MTAARRIAALAIPALLAGLSLAGCAGNAPRSHAEVVDLAACRHRVDEVYQMQNRDQRFADDQYQTSTRDSPFATNGLLGNPSAGLSSSYQRQQMVSDCLSDRAGNVGTTPAAPPTDR